MSSDKELKHPNIRVCDWDDYTLDTVMKCQFGEVVKYKTRHLIEQLCKLVDGKEDKIQALESKNKELVAEINKHEWISVDVEPDYSGFANVKHVAIVNNVGYWVVVFWNTKTKKWLDDEYQPIDVLYYKYVESLPITPPKGE